MTQYPLIIPTYPWSDVRAGYLTDTLNNLTRCDNIHLHRIVLFVDQKHWDPNSRNSIALANARKCAQAAIDESHGAIPVEVQVLPPNHDKWNSTNFYTAYAWAYNLDPQPEFTFVMEDDVVVLSDWLDLGAAILKHDPTLLCVVNRGDNIFQHHGIKSTTQGRYITQPGFYSFATAWRTSRLLEFSQLPTKFGPVGWYPQDSMTNKHIHEHQYRVAQPCLRRAYHVGWTSASQPVPDNRLRPWLMDKAPADYRRTWTKVYEGGR